MRQWFKQPDILPKLPMKYAANDVLCNLFIYLRGLLFECMVGFEFSSWLLLICLSNPMQNNKIPANPDKAMNAKWKKQ